MNALKAHVKDGQIVLDEPAELAEGAELLVFPMSAELTDEERAELERAIEEGAEDFTRGDFEDAREFALRLAARPSTSSFRSAPVVRRNALMHSGAKPPTTRTPLLVSFSKR